MLKGSNRFCYTHFELVTCLQLFRQGSLNLQFSVVLFKEYSLLYSHPYEMGCSCSGTHNSCQITWMIWRTAVHENSDRADRTCLSTFHGLLRLRPLPVQKVALTFNIRTPSSLVSTTLFSERHGLTCDYRVKTDVTTTAPSIRRIIERRSGASQAIVQLAT